MDDGSAAGEGERCLTAEALRGAPVINMTCCMIAAASRLLMLDPQPVADWKQCHIERGGDILRLSRKALIGGARENVSIRIDCSGGSGGIADRIM